MTRVIQLGDGKEIVVSSDLGTIRLSLWAHRGTLGLEMSRRQVSQLRRALFAAQYDDLPRT